MGIWKLLILFAIVLVIFGPGKLPNALRDLGKGLKGLKDELQGKGEEENKSDKTIKTITVNADKEENK